MRFEMSRRMPEVQEVVENERLIVRSDRHYTDLAVSAQEFRHLMRSKEKIVHCITDPVSESAPEAIEYSQRDQALRMQEASRIQMPDVPIEAMRDCFETMGLQTSPLVFMETSLRAQRKLSKSKYGSDAAKFFLGRDAGGRYRSELDIAAVNMNSHNWLPGATAHELGHSSVQNYVEYAWGDDGRLYYATVRSGLEGRFFSEGRAELLGTEVTNMVYDNQEAAYEGGRYIEAAKHRLRSAGHKQTAIALELVIALKPKIFPTILRGDGSDKSTQEIAAACEEIQPGLFKYLRKLRVGGTSNGAESLILHLLETQFDGDRRATLYASELCSQLFQEKLQEAA